MPHAVVTGGFGFIGSHIVEHLLREGSQVTVLDMASCPSDLDLGSGTLTVVHGDVRDTDAVADALKGAPDVIYHLASVVGVDQYLSSPLDVIDVTVLGARTVLAAAAERDIKVVVTSTSEVYGRNPRVPWAEDDDRVLGSTSAARWCYSSSKAVAEHLTHAFASERGLRACILRFFNVYGPRQRPAYAVSRTVNRLLQGLPPEVYDGGKHTRCFTYVGDAARGTLLAAASDASVGRCFNIGSNRERTIAEVVEMASKVVGTGPQAISFDTASMGSNYEDIPRRVPDVRLAEEVLGWRATTSLEDGLRQTVDWARRHGWDSPAEVKPACAR